MPQNVIYIHAHDAGRYIQPYGAPAPTPNLQRFAEDAVTFRAAFSASPACSPSRASLLTGQWPHTAGMLGLANFGFSMPDYSRHLVQRLAPHGVTSVLAGIQHVSPQVEPIGYDRVLTPHDLDPTADSATPIADAAVRYLAEADEQFFLDIGFIDAHRPYPERTDEDARWVAPPPPMPDTAETRRDTAGHLARLSDFDRAVGRVLDALVETGHLEDSIVILTTDHGLAWPGMKMTLVDQGIGVFLMVRAPGPWQGGRVVDALVSQVDLLPTIFDLLALPIPDDLDGVSLRPLVENGVEVRDAVFAETNFHVGYEPQRCVRTRRWKYIRRYLDRDAPLLAHVDPSITRDLFNASGYLQQRYPSESLFDLVLDPYENDDVAETPEHVGVLAEFRERLHRWQVETADPLLDGTIAPPANVTVYDAEVWEPSW